MAIDSDLGLVGFTCYWKQPNSPEVMDFIAKVYLKYKDSPLQEDCKSYSKGRWIVMPSFLGSTARVVNEMLGKVGMRAIIMSNE